LDRIKREIGVNVSASCIMRIDNRPLRRQKCRRRLGIVDGIELGVLQLLLDREKNEGERV